MDTYTFMREVLGSWNLVMMTVFFVAVIIWVLTRRKSAYRDDANIIFRHDDKPLSDSSTLGDARNGGKEAQQ